MKKLLLLFALLLPTAALAATTTAAGDATSRLHDLFHREWEARLKEGPLEATSVGRHEYDALLPSVTLAELQRQNGEAKAFRDEIAAIDRARLSATDQVNYDIFKRQLDNRIADFELGDYQMPFNADSGFHTGFSRLPEEGPRATVKDSQSYIRRLRASPR